MSGASRPGNGLANFWLIWYYFSHKLKINLLLVIHAAGDNCYNMSFHKAFVISFLFFYRHFSHMLRAFCFINNYFYRVSQPNLVGVLYTNLKLF
jgi:hypothetical protein